MGRLVDSALRIQTPEGITFSLEPAGAWHRFLAWLIDIMIIAAVTITLGAGITILSLVMRDLAMAVYMVLTFLFMFGYPMVMEWYCNGQTYGKRFMKIRVVDAQGLRLQPSQVFIRNLLRAVDALPVFYLVGGISVVLSRHAQRLGDLAANTIVLREAPARVLPADYDAGGKYNSLLEHPHLVARLRQQVSPEEAGVALDAMLRRNQFDEQERVELFANIADHFREVVRFPEETTLGMSDEQYVRAVVHVLFAPSEPAV